MADNYFQELYSVNVNEHTEKKNGLTYLSWAWAWAEVKKRHPDATYTIYETATGCFYHTDGRTAWVKTGVTVNGIEHVEYLPVMDARNRSIPLDAVTSFDANKAIQRSLTKACARHGLGLYVYASEDLPEGEDAPEKPKKAAKTAQTATADKPAAQAQAAPAEEKAAPGQVQYISSVTTPAQRLMLCAKYHIDRLEDMTRAAASATVAQLQRREAGK